MVSELSTLPASSAAPTATAPDVDRLRALPAHLASQIKGQGQLLDRVCSVLTRGELGFANPRRPKGSFLFVGPTGVGKTELTNVFTAYLFDGAAAVRFDMSEYQLQSSVEKLIGGSRDDSGLLGRALRGVARGTLLFDEVEKAHPDVHEVFFQVFDKGWMEDGQGTRVDFKNTIILLTSNVGSDLIMKMAAQGQKPDPAQIAEALRAPLLEVFPAALLGRVVVIPYYPLSDEMLGNIVRLQLDRVKKRVTERYQIPFSYDDAVVQLISSRCTELESGGRMIDAVLTNTLLPEISRELLLRTLDGRPISVVRVSARENVFEYAFD